MKEVVAPPFMYGNRNPSVSGIIRRNDEISDESKRVLSRTFFGPRSNAWRNIDQIEAVEVVSDESVHRAHDATHLEAGVGVVATTRMNGDLPTSIVLNCTHVGIGNSFKKFHANQARIACIELAEKQLAGRGLVLSVARLGEGPLTSDGFMEITRLRCVSIKNRVDSEKYATEDLSIDAKRHLFAPYNYMFDIVNGSSVLIHNETDSIVCGATAVSNGLFTDCFITDDCPRGQEKELIEFFLSRLSGTSLEISSSDELVSRLFSDETSEGEELAVSALPVGLTVEEQNHLLQRPWVFSGLFSHLFHEELF